MPESIRICGLLIAPPQRMTSPARASCDRPMWTKATPDGAAVLDQDAGDMRMGQDVQVGMFHRRAQEGCGDRSAALGADGGLEGARAFLRRQPVTSGL